MYLKNKIHNRTFQKEDAVMNKRALRDDRVRLIQELERNLMILDGLPPTPKLKEYAEEIQAALNDAIRALKESSIYDEEKNRIMKLLSMRQRSRNLFEKKKPTSTLPKRFALSAYDTLFLRACRLVWISEEENILFELAHPPRQPQQQ